MPIAVRPSSFRFNRSHNVSVAASANVATTVIEIETGPANPSYCGYIYYAVSAVVAGGGIGLVVYGSRDENTVSRQAEIVLQCFGAISIVLAFVLACIGYRKCTTDP